MNNMGNINYLVGLAPQLRKIVTHCQDNGFITSLQAARDLNITSLHRRLSDLRARGYVVHKTTTKSRKGVVYARYYISTRPIY
jgi:hypothetical protein